MESNPFADSEVNDSASSTPLTPTASRRQMSLKVNHYPVLLKSRANGSASRGECMKWTASELPDSVRPTCVGASTWVIGAGNELTSGQRSDLPQMEEVMPPRENGTDIATQQSRQHIGRINTATRTNSFSEQDDSGMIKWQPKYSLSVCQGSHASSSNAQIQPTYVQSL
ncbi:hypothetical protein AAVH_36499, partial [Aphelenchoides avenae]